MEQTEKHLRALHLATAFEAIALGTASGLNGSQLYAIFSTSAAQSWTFNYVIPNLLSGKALPFDVDEALDDIQEILKQANECGFFSPMTSVVEQYLLSVKASGGVHKYYETLGVSSLKQKNFTPSRLPSSSRKPTVGFVGLGAMGLGMASILYKAGFAVKGFDVFPQSVEKFVTVGGQRAASAAEAAIGVEVLLIMCATSAQADTILFGEDGAASKMSKGAVVLLCATVAPSYITELNQKLARSAIKLVDAPVSGGTYRAASGELSIMCSGDTETLQIVSPVLNALAGKEENVYVIEGKVGSGCKVKMVNQVLAGTQCVCTAEALAFSVARGLVAMDVYEWISSSRGASWMWSNRGHHMVTGDFSPLSATTIFIKDMNIVVSEARRLGLPSVCSSMAQQLFILSAAAGHSKDDDSSVVKVWEKACGIKTY